MSVKASEAVSGQAAEYWRGVVEGAVTKKNPITQTELKRFQDLLKQCILEQLKEKESITLSCGKLTSDSVLEGAAKNAGLGRSISSLGLPDLVTRVTREDFSPRKLYAVEREEAKKSSAS